MIVVFIWLLIGIDMYYFLLIYQQISNDAAKVGYSYPVLSSFGFDKNWKIFFIYFFDWFENCEKWWEMTHKNI